MKFKKGDIVKYRRSENWVGIIVQFRPKRKNSAYVRWIGGPYRGIKPTTVDLKNLTMHDARRNYEV